LAGGNNTVIFTKAAKGMQVQTLDRDGNAKGTSVTLNDKDLTGEKIATSTRITGEVVYTSPNVFTIVPADDDSLFRDDPSSASLQKISDMDILTVRKAQRMLSSVDGALRRIDAERGDLGATMNRMQHTIDNLSNIVVNTELSRSRIRDADMAEESVQLSKYQVLQQAANAMLAQANQSMSSVLDLLR
jgi:flagellin